MVLRHATLLLFPEVVTWGHPDMGGNSADVQHQLIDVLTIEVYSFAWAALRTCACTELAA